MADTTRRMEKQKRWTKTGVTFFLVKKLGTGDGVKVTQCKASEQGSTALKHGTCHITTHEYVDPRQHGHVEFLCAKHPILFAMFSLVPLLRVAL